jgi:hypothetical protein
VKTDKDRVLKELDTWVANIALENGNCDPTALLLAIKSGVRDPEACGADGWDALDLTIWETVLKQHMDGYDIDAIAEKMMYGLLDNNLWQKLTSAHAHEYIALALAKIDSGQLLFAWSMAKKILPHHPPALVNSRDLAAVLFGEPWCCLIYDQRESRASMLDLIHTTAPAFLRGWVEGTVEGQVLALPGLEP